MGSHNQFLTYGQIYLTIQINAFLYYLGRLPILGKMIHDSWYSHYRIKKIWSLFGLVCGFVRSVLADNLGLLVILYVIPCLFLQKDAMTPGVCLLLFILLKCVCSALIECRLFKSTQEDYVFLNHFMVDPISYYRYKALKNAFFSSVMLFPALFILFGDWGMTGMLVAGRFFSVLFGDVLYLWIYKKAGHLPGKRVRSLAVFPLILAAYGGAYLGLYREVAISRLWQAGISIVCLLLAAACWHYHMHYRDYKKIAVKFANQSVVSIQVTVQSHSMGEGEDGLTEGSWEENKAFFQAHQKEAPEQYLDLAFWGRYGKMLRKEKRDKILILSVACVMLGLGIRLGWLPVTSDTVLDYSPVLIALATFLSFANRLMQIYFRNIDLHMLSHRIATPEFIRSTMLQRYLYLLKGVLFSAIVLAAALLLILFGSGLQLPLATMIRLWAVCVLFLVFWETYECIVYYLVQPYSADMTAKSPVFKVLGWLEGIFYLLVLFVRRDLTAALPVVGASCIFMIVLFLVSRKIAPKTFRLR